nr:CRISPR-associated helicase Cas3' [Salinibacter ruber]
MRLADQRASQIEGDGPDPLPVRPFRYQFGYDDGKRPVQSLAEQNAQRQFLALRAETGSGKTDAALLWARKQVRQRKARRVIFALPTRFTSTSLAEDIGGGLYHSSAWRRLDGDRVGDRLEMASTFLAPRVVTTIDQVLAAVAGRRELDHTRFANLAHSALVIDECDFYDDVVQANIDFLTDVCDALGVPVLVMSATLPTAQTSVYFPGDEEGEVLEADGEGEWSSSFTIAEVKEAEEFPWEITGPRAIVYANTTARARRFYRSIAENRQDVVLYHSRFTEPDKAEKERKIRDMLGDDGSGGVAVMTQIGEMSLNVSAPLQISDLPPADRLAQRTGRMGRFKQIDGELRLIIPQKNGRFYPAPYGTLVRGEGWTPAPALLETKSALEQGMTLSKQNLTELTDRIYGESMELSAEATQNRRSYADVFKNGWLVLPDTPATDEDLSGSRWQARMIPPTEDVWVAPSKLEGLYESFRAWRLATSKHTCTVPHYVTEAGEDKLDRTSVRVSQEEKSIAVLKDPSIYSSDEGLLL